MGENCLHSKIYNVLSFLIYGKYFIGNHCVLSTLSSSGKNDECEMFICECDRKAAECFSESHWNPEHEHLPSDRCQ